MSDIIVVKANHDPEAGVWYTESSDVHGLRIEAETLEALVERIPEAVRDLIEDEDAITRGTGTSSPISAMPTLMSGRRSYDWRTRSTGSLRADD